MKKKHATTSIEFNPAFTVAPVFIVNPVDKKFMRPFLLFVEKPRGRLTIGGSQSVHSVSYLKTFHLFVRASPFSTLTEVSDESAMEVNHWPLGLSNQPRIVRALSEGSFVRLTKRRLNQTLSVLVVHIVTGTLLIGLGGLAAEAAIPPQVYRIEDSPSAWTRQQATRILTDLKSRPQPTDANGPSAETGSGSRAESLSLGISAQRSDWMRFIYKMNWVDRSAANALLADKLLFFRVAERELGDAVNDYLIPTTGLREFLWEEKLVDQDGRLTSDAARIEAAVYKRFPTGVLVRPAVGVSSKETGLGLFKDSDEFIAALVNPQSILYQPIHMKKPVRSTVLDLVASGETVVLQADVVRAAHDKVKAAQGSPPKSLRWKEVRVHTYSGKVLSDATPHPWLSRHSVTATEVQQAQFLVSEFLGRLPREVLTKQAWSFDVTILADGQFRIAELITNRGKQAAWSSYLDQPNVISAYTAAFETESGSRIPGIGGWVARSGFANASDYWSKRFSIWKRQVKATMIAK